MDEMIPEIRRSLFRILHSILLLVHIGHLEVVLGTIKTVWDPANAHPNDTHDQDRGTANVKKDMSPTLTVMMMMTSPPSASYVLLASETAI
jgi:hypothetical protein